MRSHSCWIFPSTSSVAKFEVFQHRHGVREPHSFHGYLRPGRANAGRSVLPAHLLSPAPCSLGLHKRRRPSRAALSHMLSGDWRVRALAYSAVCSPCRLCMLLLLCTAQAWLMWRFIHSQLRHWREYWNEQSAKRRVPAAPRLPTRLLKRESGACQNRRAGQRVGCWSVGDTRAPSSWGSVQTCVAASLAA